MKLYWFNKNCCVPDCLNSSTAGAGCTKEYYDLPAEPRARKRWLEAIFIQDAEDLKVCEDHFQDGDIFRDKSNRKKLRLNSVPTQKLPQNIVCKVCSGVKHKLDQAVDCKLNLCACPLPVQPLQPVISSPNKRTRMSWSREEKKVIFKGIKDYGDVKKGKFKSRVNWANVISYCRNHGCYGNEKELRICWQNMRANAKKVNNLEMKGTILDRKICKYMFGRIPKKPRQNGVKAKEETAEVPSSEEEKDEGPESNAPIIAAQEHIDAKLQGEEGTDKKEATEETEEMQSSEEDEASDEYYSISDVEEKFHVRIRPEPREIISLLSSDEDE